jgi:hypothetical protein
MSHFSATRFALNENKLRYVYYSMCFSTEYYICIYICIYIYVYIYIFLRTNVHRNTQGVATFNVQNSLHKHEQFAELLMPSSHAISSVWYNGYIASAVVLRNAIYLMTYFKLTLLEVLYS